MAGFYRTAVIDTVVESSPAEYLRRPRVPPESPTLGLTHLQFEALLTAARVSPNRSDFALVAMLGLLGLRIFEACALDVADLREEHGHRVLRVLGKGGRVVLVPLPPAVGRAVDAAIGDRASGPILLNTRGARALMNALGRSGQSDRARGGRQGGADLVADVGEDCVVAALQVHRGGGAEVDDRSDHPCKR